MKKALGIILLGWPFLAFTVYQLHKLGLTATLGGTGLFLLIIGSFALGTSFLASPGMNK